ncbi:hypothetical protein BGZ94_006767, partial [Podila epigama]
VSLSPLFIASGALAASIFATLGSVIGAAKILQAIARDNLLPVLSVFGQGTPKTDEPTLAVLLTYILCQFCLFLTDMNSIATFVSMIMLLTFLIINLACFLLKIGSAPNFRPSFRFFHWYTAFGGMVLCAMVMGFVDLGKSLLSGLIVAVIFVWIHYWSPPKRWGDVTQSLIYHQVRKYLLRLDSRKEHVKFWRPQILLLVHHPRSEYHLIQFCNHLKKGALYVLGHVIQGDLRSVLQEYRRQQVSWLKFVDFMHIKAFVNLSVADSIAIGARNLLIGTGLGGMRPNIVVMGSFNLQRHLQEKDFAQSQQQQQQQQQQGQEQFPGGTTKGSGVSLTPNDALYQHGHNHGDHIMNIPVSLPIDNIRTEKPIKITEYVSIIEDVLSLNKAIAIGYGFDSLELPDEQHAKSSWKLFNFGSRSSTSLSSSPIIPPSLSCPSSLHKDEDLQNMTKKKKKYIDLWPMQMSMTPLPHDLAPGQSRGHKRASRDMGSSYSPMPGQGHSASNSDGQSSGGGGGGGGYRTAEAANLINFDTYTMVLQMGCILHMVPHWKENYLLRVMVFVEYSEDVEEERKRLSDLLENLRIPAEINVLCLEDGDSETYDRLVLGQQEGFSPEEEEEDEDEEEEETDDHATFEATLATHSNTVLSSSPSEFPQETAQQAPLSSLPVSVGENTERSQKQRPKFTHHRWRSETLLEEDEAGDFDRASTIDKDGDQSSHEIGPYSGVAGKASDRTRTLSSSGASPTGNSNGGRFHTDPIFEPSGPPMQRRRTISHPVSPLRGKSSGHPGGLPQPGGSPLRVNTALSPRLRQGPMSASFASPQSRKPHPSGWKGAQLRYHRSMTGSTSPLESRLGTSVPLGASMNFRIALPLPRQYYDPNHINSSDSESDSISSDDDEDVYDRNDDDLYYGSQHPRSSSLGRHPSVQRPSALTSNPTPTLTSTTVPIANTTAMARADSLGNGRRRRGSMQVSPHRSFQHHIIQPVTPTYPQQPQQQQQQQQLLPQHPPQQSRIAPTFLGSEPGLGISLGMPTIHSEQVLSSHLSTDNNTTTTTTTTTTNTPIISNNSDNNNNTLSASPQTSDSLVESQPQSIPISNSTTRQAPVYQHSSCQTLIHDDARGASMEEASSTGSRIGLTGGAQDSATYANDALLLAHSSHSEATLPSRELVTGSVPVQPSMEDGSQSEGKTGQGIKDNGHDHNDDDDDADNNEDEDDMSVLYGLDTTSLGPFPLQFDHLGPKAQLRILNELMRTHSSPETTSIVLTTMPAPEAGTCLYEQSSYAYLKSLDVLMDQIQVPVLLIHAKSLTVTMTL